MVVPPGRGGAGVREGIHPDGFENARAGGGAPGDPVNLSIPCQARDHRAAGLIDPNRAKTGVHTDCVFKKARAWRPR